MSSCATNSSKSVSSRSPAAASLRRVLRAAAFARLASRIAPRVSTRRASRAARRRSKKTSAASFSASFAASFAASSTPRVVASASVSRISALSAALATASSNVRASLSPASATTFSRSFATSSSHAARTAASSLPGGFRARRDGDPATRDADVSSATAARVRSRTRALASDDFQRAKRSEYSRHASRNTRVASPTGSTREPEPGGARGRVGARGPDAFGPERVGAFGSEERVAASTTSGGRASSIAAETSASSDATSAAAAASSAPSSDAEPDAPASGSSASGAPSRPRTTAGCARMMNAHSSFLHDGAPPASNAIGGRASAARVRTAETSASAALRVSRRSSAAANRSKSPRRWRSERRVRPSAANAAAAEARGDGQSI